MSARGNLDSWDEVSYPGKMYSVSSQLVLPCHLSISSVYALADNNEARKINHLYLPVLGTTVSEKPRDDEGTKLLTSV